MPSELPLRKTVACGVEVTWRPDFWLGRRLARLKEQPERKIEAVNTKNSLRNIVGRV